MELENGTVVRLTTNLYVGHHSKQKGLEFHGDLGSLGIGSSKTSMRRSNLANYRNRSRCLMSASLSKALSGAARWLRSTTPSRKAVRSTGAQAASVVEICCAIVESYQTGKPVEVTSNFSGALADGSGRVWVRLGKTCMFSPEG